MVSVSKKSSGNEAELKKAQRKGQAVGAVAGQIGKAVKAKNRPGS